MPRQVPVRQATPTAAPRAVAVRTSRPKDHMDVFVEDLVHKFSYCQPKYININIMAGEIKAILFSVIRQARRGAHIEEDNIRSISDSIQTILTCLKPKFYGTDSGQLSPNLKDRDLDIHSAIKNYLSAKFDYVFV